MFVTIEGKYRDGRIELSEPPRGLSEARVLVTFLPAVVAVKTQPDPTARQIVFGQFKGERVTSVEDFRIAEWRGEPEVEDGR